MTLCFVLNEPGVRGRDDGLENCFWSDTWAPGDASALSFSLSSVQFSTLTVTTGCSSVEPSAEKVGSPTKFVALGKKISSGGKSTVPRRSLVELPRNKRTLSGVTFCLFQKHSHLWKSIVPWCSWPTCCRRCCSRKGVRCVAGLADCQAIERKLKLDPVINLWLVLAEGSFQTCMWTVGYPVEPWWSLNAT